MRVTCEPDDQMQGVMLAAATGRLDVHGVTHLWDAIPGRITKDTPSLLMDMSGVDVMTSAGVGVLIKMLNHLESLGGRMALFGCNAKVRRVLQICELETVLNVCDEADEARRAIGQAG